MHARVHVVHLLLNFSGLAVPFIPVSAAIKSVQPVVSLSATTDEFSRECVDFFGEAVQLFRGPPSVGEIYGLLFASQEPLSFSDIFERLDISKGSASQGLNLLRSLGAVHTVAPADGNGRREYFSPELSLRKLLRGVLDERVTPLAGKSTGRFTRLRELADASGGRERKFRLGRVQQLETWRRRMKAVVPVLGTLLGTKT
jgi:DNA-binding transcriptional regulator GbsR (MarR family)